MKKYTIKLNDAELNRIIYALNQQDRKDVIHLNSIIDIDDHDIFSNIIEENIELTSKLIAFRD